MITFISACTYQRMLVPFDPCPISSSLLISNSISLRVTVSQSLTRDGASLFNFLIGWWAWLAGLALDIHSPKLSARDLDIKFYH